MFWLFGLQGKVLIPVFAVGRAQELCMLLNSYWQRMQLQYPIYFGGGMTEKANKYYKLYVQWTGSDMVHRLDGANAQHSTFDDQVEEDAPPGPGRFLHFSSNLQLYDQWDLLINSVVF